MKSSRSTEILMILSIIIIAAFIKTNSKVTRQSYIGKTEGVSIQINVWNDLEEFWASETPKTIIYNEKAELEELFEAVGLITGEIELSDKASNDFDELQLIDKKGNKLSVSLAADDKEGENVAFSSFCERKSTYEKALLLKNGNVTEEISLYR